MGDWRKSYNLRRIAIGHLVNETTLSDRWVSRKLWTPTIYLPCSTIYLLFPLVYYEYYSYPNTMN